MPSQCHLLCQVRPSASLGGADALGGALWARRPPGRLLNDRRCLILRGKSGTRASGPRGHPDQGVRPTINAESHLSGKLKSIGLPARRGLPTCWRHPSPHLAKLSRGTTTISAVTRSAPARDAPAITDAYMAAETTAKPMQREPPPSACSSASGSTISMNAAYWSRLTKGPRTPDSPGGNSHKI